MKGTLSHRAAAAIGMKVKQSDAVSLYHRFLSDYDGFDSAVLEFCQRIAFDEALVKPERWEQALAVIAKGYTNGVTLDHYRIVSSHQRSRQNPELIPIEVAKQIASQPAIYPRILVALADAQCREDVQAKITPVGVIAEREHWAV